MDDAESIGMNRCPVCGNFGLIEGPRGGAGQNVFCASPTCRSAFNIAPRFTPVLAQRIGVASEAFYPPRVHLLQHGQPLCGFAGYGWVDNGPPPRLLAKTPDQWPIGHTWVGIDEATLCTCPLCKNAATTTMGEGL